MKAKKNKSSFTYNEIPNARKILLNRAYPHEHLTRGLGRYWLWEVSKDFVIYTHENNDITTKVFIDAIHVDLFKLLCRIEGVIPPKRGTTPNQKFNRFAALRESMSDEHTIIYEGWRLHFKSEDSFHNFLNICESYVRGGLREAEKVFEQAPKKAIPITSKVQTNQVRVGQAGFRAELIKYWKGCAVTGCDIFPALKASHIKPWSDASPTEKLDSFNGLLLMATLDALFDAGLISFNENGGILISSKISSEHYESLGIHTGLKLRKCNTAHLEYLKYHQEKIFIQ